MKSKLFNFVVATIIIAIFISLVWFTAGVGKRIIASQHSKLAVKQMNSQLKPGDLKEISSDTPNLIIDISTTGATLILLVIYLRFLRKDL